MYAEKVKKRFFLFQQKKRHQICFTFSTSTGPLFSLSMGSNQYYSYGAINILILPLIAIQNNFMHLMPHNKLIISLKLCTHIGFSDTTDVHEIKLCLNPMNEALVNDFANMLKDPKYSDVTIICAGEEALKAHKCILAG